eukprot:782621-Rhodomonas_salina.1
MRGAAEREKHTRTETETERQSERARERETFPRTTMSGLTPSWSTARSMPVRPHPSTIAKSVPDTA